MRAPRSESSAAPLEDQCTTTVGVLELSGSVVRVVVWAVVELAHDVRLNLGQQARAGFALQVALLAQVTQHDKARGVGDEVPDAGRRGLALAAASVDDTLGVGPVTLT